MGLEARRHGLEYQGDGCIRNMSILVHRPRLEDISAYLDDRLEPRRAERLKRHLEVCAACRRERDSLALTAQLLRGAPKHHALRPLALPVSAQKAQARYRRIEAGLGALRTASAVVAVVLAFLVGADTLVSRGLVQLPVQPVSRDAAPFVVSPPVVAAPEVMASAEAVPAVEVATPAAAAAALSAQPVGQGGPASAAIAPTHETQALRSGEQAGPAAPVPTQPAAAARAMGTEELVSSPAFPSAGSPAVASFGAPVAGQGGAGGPGLGGGASGAELGTTDLPGADAVPVGTPLAAKSAPLATGAVVQVAPISQATPTPTADALPAQPLPTLYPTVEDRVPQPTDAPLAMAVRPSVEPAPQGEPRIREPVSDAGVEQQAQVAIWALRAWRAVRVLSAALLGLLLMLVAVWVWLAQRRAA